MYNLANLLDQYCDLRNNFKMTFLSKRHQNLNIGLKAQLKSGHINTDPEL